MSTGRGRQARKPSSTVNRVDLKAQSRLARLQPAAAGAHTVPRAGAPEYTIDQLDDKAEELLETGQYELAARFCDKALAMDDTDARALEAKALALLELGQPGDATALLLRATAAEPSQGHSKFMYLGQLLEGQPAVDAFSAGIQLLHAELEDIMAACGGRAVSEDIAEHIRACSGEISTAFCSMAELYMSDLCDDDGAQEACVSCAEQALQFDARNVQAMQTMASLSISLQQPDAALSWLQQSIQLWHRAAPDGDHDIAAVTGALGVEAATDAGSDADGDWMDENDDEAEELLEPPPYLFRISTVKLLLELQQFETAAQLLDALLSEDEEVAQTWYLMGWLHHLQGDLPSAAGYFLKMQKVFSAMGCDDTQLMEHANELLTSYPAFDAPVPTFDAPLPEFA